MLNRMQTLTGDAAYGEITAYLSDNDKAILQTGIAELPATLQSDEDLAAAVRQGQWERLFHADNQDRDHFSLQALRCLRAGLIDNMTFCTSQMFYNIFTHPTHTETAIRVIPIFSASGKINPLAKQMIDATMRMYFSSLRMHREQLKREQQESLSNTLLAKVKETSPLLALFAGVLADDKSLDTSAWDDPKNQALMCWEKADEVRFYKMLQQLPVSEQQFLVLPDPQFDGTKFLDDEHKTVMRAIQLRLFFNVFGRFRIQGKPVCMIPTRGMMQANLVATYGDNAPRAVYRFGLSPISGLYETMKAGGRDLYQYFQPLAHLDPEKLDNHRAPVSHAEGELHDFYHQSLAANIPPQEIKLMCEFIDALYEIAAKHKECREFAEGYASLILDLEHGIYRKYSLRKLLNPSPNYSNRAVKLWTAIEGSDPTKLPILDDAAKSEQCSALVQPFVNFLLENEERFKTQYDFSIDTLLDYGTEPKYPFMYAVKPALRTALKQKMHALSFAQLIASIDPSQISRSKMVLEVIKEKINGDLAAALLFAAQKNVKQFDKRILKHVCKNFQRFIEDGQFAALQKNQPQLFEMVVQAMRNSKYKERNLIIAAEKYDENPLAFDMLYEKQNVNRVSEYSGATLLYHATRAKSVALLMRLTSDGATVTQVAGSVKSSAMKKAIKLGREDIQALLMMADTLGADWMQQMPASRDRLRRLADYYKNDVEYPLLAKDVEWAKKVSAKVPDKIRQALDDESKQSPRIKRRSIFAGSSMPIELIGMISAMMMNRKGGSN